MYVCKKERWRERERVCERERERCSYLPEKPRVR